MVIKNRYPETRTTYPWKKWANGKLHVLTPGVDFRVRLSSLRVAAFHYAQRNGLVVATTTRLDGKIEMQFSKPEKA